MDPEIILLESESQMNDAVINYEKQIQKINVGVANPNLVGSIKVNYYEVLTPIRELASIVVPQGNQILITPYDKSVCKGIVHAIVADQALGFSPTLEGDKVRIVIPPITLERREALIKKLRGYTEAAKVHIRQTRQNANKKIEELKISEDLIKDFKDENQELTTKFIGKIDVVEKNKEKEILTI